MKKISHVLLIALLLLTSCGFSPMLKNVNFGDLKIKKIEYFWPK